MNVPHARSRTIRRRVLATAVACCFSPLLASANPVGPVVSAGQASFNTQGKMLTVTNSPGAIINWQGFSIGAGETTRFVQQNAASAVLNRVVGGQSSSILGALQSNGRVFLINPNGIIFGAGAQIDTAGLIASTLNIMDTDFLTGKLRFGQTPDAKSITNAGEIRTPAGGRVMLIAPEGVTNTGIIHAPNGDVILAAGKTVELTDSANPEVRVEVAAPEAKAMNLGKIVAESGKVGIYGGLVVNHGVVNANSATVGENGRIVFRAAKDATLEAGSVTTANGASGGSVEVSSGGTTLVAGDVQAKGSAGNGGEVKILGERVGLTGNASVDASGQSGGGNVLVGGDLQGANAAIQNAKQTYVGADTRITADALAAGDGGKVIVWADDTTRSYGSISARGGQSSGNGGFVETSGKGGLDVRSGPDVRAPAGRPGTWLLDPVDLEVVAGGIFDSTLNSGSPFFAPLTESSRIGVDLINAQLDFGSNVILTTTSRGSSPGSQQGNITISAPIVKAAESQLGGPFIGTTSLTLQAHNDIIITPTGSITSTGDPLTVNLIANSDNSGGGGITIGGAVTTRGASFFANAKDAININAPISTVNAAATSGGSVQVTAQTGAISVAGAIAGGFVALNGAGGVNVSQPIAATSSINLDASNGATTVGASLSSTNGSVSLAGKTGIKITNGAQVTTSQFGSFSAQVDGSPGVGSLDIDAGSAVNTSSANLYADNMEIQGAVNASTGGIAVQVYNSGRGMDLGTNIAGKLALTQAELSNLKTSSSLYFYSDGATTVSAPVAFTQPNYVYLYGGTDITTNAGASLTSASQMYLQANNTMTFGAPVTAPILSLYAGGMITQNAGANFATTGDLNLYGAGLTLNAASSGGDVFLTGNTLTLGGTVASGSDIDVMPRDFVAVNLGVSTKGAGTLDLTAAELNRFTPAAGTGVLKIGSTGSSLLTVQGAIAPTGTQTLVLSSGSGIGQASGATIAIPTLGIQSYGNVTLDKGNAVGTLVAELYSNNANMVYTNAPGAALTVGDIPTSFMSGVQAYGGNAAITLSADAMTIASGVYSGAGTVTLQPTTASLKVDLGGADVAGTALGLSAADIAQVSGSKLLVKADKVDVTAPIQANTSALGVAPLTQAAGPAPRGLSIVASKTGGSDLELTNADIANVTASEFVLGDASTGAINVQSAVAVPTSIGTLTLNTGNQSTGITVNAAMTSDTSFKLITDTMNLNAPVSTTAGSILITPNSVNRPIELGGRTAGTLGLSAFEIENHLSAPAGTLTFGSSTAGNIDVTSSLDLAGPNPPLFRDLSLMSGGTITVGSDWSISTPGSITLNAPRITLDGNLHSVEFGNLSLTADRMDINASILAQNSSSTAGAGEIRIQPRTARLITLGSDDTGSSLGLTPTEVTNLQAQSVVRIGDAVNTRSIQIDSIANAVIQPVAPVLSLIGGPSNVNNSITQTGAGTIAVSALAAVARNNVTLDNPNDIDTVAAATWSTGNITLTYSGSNPFNIGLVDGVAGLQTANGNIRVRTDEININQPIVAGFGSRDVTIVPLSPNQSITLGTKSGGSLSMDAAELNRIAASTMVIGETGNTGDINVAGAVTFTGSGNGVVNNLVLENKVAKTISIGGALTVPGSVTLNTSNLIVGVGGITSQAGSVIASADAMTISAPVSALSGNITLQPRSTGLQIAVGGADVISTTLGLDTTDLGNLAYGGTLLIGSNNAGNMDVNYAGPNLANNVALSTGGTATFNNAFAVAGKLNVTANSIDVASNITGNTGVAMTTATPGRDIVLGSNPGGAALELDTAELGRISTGANGTLAFDTTGTLTTTAALTFTTVDNLQLGAGALTHTGGTLTAPKDVTLRANTMTLGSNVASASGGRILVAPRVSSFRAMNLGTNPAGSALGLTAAEIARLSTSGVVQFGDTTSTGSISVTQAISQPAGSSALMLASNGGISQSAGATITADKLRLQSFSSVNLSESNSVNTLAGSSSGSFSFSNGTPLAIGTVDGQAGISDSNVTLRANALDIAAPISGTTVTLAPLTGGTQVSLGTETAGQLSITDAELDQIAATTVVIGTSAAPNATGNINVNASVDRGFGNLSLVTGAGNTINVNAPVGSATTSSVQMNAGAGGTANINAGVLASGTVTVNADTISTSQQITSNSGSINLANIGTAGSITLGGVLDAFTAVSATGKTITVNAPVTARRNTGSINLSAPVGSTGSSVTINNQLTAGTSINITTDSIAINAPLVTLNSTISLQPRTAGMPISVGTETSGAFSLSSSELALLDTDVLTIGSTSAGPLTVNAPISSSTLQQLSLQSNGDITQSPTAPIVLSYSITDPQSGFVQPAATLNVVSNSGKVELAAANDINNSVTGQAGGSTQNFVFNNLSPLKLQNVSPELGFAPTGKALLSAPPGSFVPRVPTSVLQEQAIDAALAAILQAGETQKKADKDADDKKEEGEQKDREERKKEGKKSCS